MQKLFQEIIQSNAFKLYVVLGTLETLKCKVVFFIQVDFFTFFHRAYFHKRNLKYFVIITKSGQLFVYSILVYGTIRINIQMQTTALIVVVLDYQLLLFISLTNIKKSF